VKRSIAAAALLIALEAPAQNFEVASIRPHAGPLHSIMDLKISGPRITLGAYTISQLVTEAYHLKGTWQLSFVNSTGRDDELSIYYDVAARAPDIGSPSREEFRKMLRSLLADRFKLSLHREMKPTAVYALSAGKTATKLKKGTGDGDCSLKVGVEPGGQSYNFANCSIAELVSVLGQGVADRPVIDRTGLAENYDFQFTAMPLNMRRAQTDPGEISLFTAMRDLGLALHAQTEPMEIIVIDHFERPSAN
jgi:bla regulator protein blaR1